MREAEHAAAMLAGAIEDGEVKQHAVACGDCGASMVLEARIDRSKPVLDLFYRCTECRATHGARDDGAPVGVPGDGPTRAARIRAHEALDRLWRGAAQMYDDLPEEPAAKLEAIRRLEQVARGRAYHWLAERMQLPREECHIGRFDGTTCELVVLLCQTVGPYEVRAWAKARTSAPQTPPAAEAPTTTPEPAEVAPTPIPDAELASKGADALTLEEWGRKRDLEGREW